MESIPQTNLEKEAKAKGRRTSVLVWVSFAIFLFISFINLTVMGINYGAARALPIIFGAIIFYIVNFISLAFIRYIKSDSLIKYLPSAISLLIVVVMLILNLGIGSPLLYFFIPIVQIFLISMNAKNSAIAFSVLMLYILPFAGLISSFAYFD